MKIFQYLLLILVYFIEIRSSQQEPCSAMDSYLQITSDSVGSQTILSSQALFPPNTYYIPPTSITIVSSTDNPCNASQINTNIINKVVLLHTTTQCSDHYQTNVVEQNGAIAVLIASIDNTINSIPGSIAFNTTIPVRGITKFTADWIIKQLSTGSINIEVEFGCDHTIHPLIICALDLKGAHWRLDGDYIRQINQTYNTHPIWAKQDGYLFDYYIFLHTANRTDEWYWAITADDTFTNDALIMAYCIVGGSNISEPSDCPLWNTSSYYRTGNLRQYSINKNFTVSAAVCSIDDEYICIQSNQSSLAGLQGTYRLYNKNVPIWFRELNECDGTPGIVRYQRYDGYIKILDIMDYRDSDYWTVAECNTNLSRSDYNYSRDAYNPQLCTQWKTVMDYSLDPDNMIIDDTLTVITNKCESHECITNIAPPDNICLSKNSVLHSFLEGTYIKTGVIDNNGFVEYVRKETLYDADGDVIRPYLWQYRYYEGYNWWILSPQNVSFANRTNGRSVWYWGYSLCSIENPVNCKAPWNFYWGVTGSSHSDPSFKVTQDECPTESTLSPPDYGEEYDYICIDIEDIDAFKRVTTLDPYEFIGGYKINRSINSESISGGIPYWEKPINDYTDNITRISYDALYGHWQIGAVNGDVVMLCMTDSVYPQQCERWYDMVDAEELSNVMKFKIDECGYTDMLRKSCSAMRSWLQLTTDDTSETTIDDVSGTIVSAQTLFPPYFYTLHRTEIIRLDLLTENPCDINGITTDLTGKMVLLFPTNLPIENVENEIRCSDHYQLYVMQQNNASAAIISSIDDFVEYIVDDNGMEGLITNIPMRQISLSKALKIAELLDDGHRVYGEFACNDSFKYPVTICASNTDLQIVGNYEYQKDLNIPNGNGHPIYKREGYSMYSKYQNVYLYLHNGYGSDPWFWAITRDPKLKDDDYMIANCTKGGDLIIKPTDCPQWMVLNNDNDDDDENKYSLSNLTLSDSLCNVTNNYFCIRSSESSLAGLQGTYRLFHDGEPIWFREPNDCDTHPAIFVFESGYFMLSDPMDGWLIAYCYIGQDFDGDTYDSLQFEPTLCREWKTLLDGTLDNNDYINDNTLTIELNVKCSQPQCIDGGIAPNELCMHQNSVMHSFLEGEYIGTGVIGYKTNKTKEYVRTEQLYYNNNPIHVYLWWYGELSDKYPWWIVAAHNMSIAQKQNYSLVYGYIACNTINPANCRGSWNFYWSGSTGYGSWHNDQEFDMLEGECPMSTTPGGDSIYDEEYDYLCVDIINNEWNLTVTNMFRGGYIINRSSTIFSEDTPYWYKPPNDYYNNETYIYYDEFFGYWQIGTSLGQIETKLICMANTPYPQHCNEWYDLKSNSLNNIIKLRIDGCGSSDVLSITITTNGPSPYKVAIGVIVIIIIILICCCIGYCIYSKILQKNQDSAEIISSTEVASKIKTKNKTKTKIKTKRGHTQLSTVGDESDDDDDGEDGTLTNINITAGGYDMSPLHKDTDNDDNDDNDTDHHHGEENEDQQENDIDDGEDGILMTKF